jgi:hypothetical protein
MLQAIIFRNNGWTVTSYGNGLAYLLRDACGREAFLQGDDALDWRVRFDNADAIEDPERAMRFKREEILVETMCAEIERD